MNVICKNKECDVKTITVEDNTADVKIILWRDIANSDIHLREFVEVTNVVINEYQNQINLTTQQSAIKVSYAK